MTPIYTFTVLVKTINESNGDKGMTAQWKKIARRKDAKKAVAEITATVPAPVESMFPLVVELTRLSAGVLDDDAVPGACKAVRDALAAWLGVDDKHRDRVRYRYEQAKCAKGEYGVLVRVFARARVVEMVESLEESA